MREEYAQKICLYFKEDVLDLKNKLWIVENLTMEAVIQK